MPMFIGVKFGLFFWHRVFVFCFVSDCCNCCYVDNQHTVFVHLHAYVHAKYILQLNNINNCKQKGKRKAFQVLTSHK